MFVRDLPVNTTEDLANQIDLSTLLTVDEIVTTILDELEYKDTVYLAAMDSSDLITLHHSTGRYIRNSFGLWINNNPNIVNHPDDTLMEILTLCWKEVQNIMPITSQKMKFK